MKQNTTIGHWSVNGRAGSGSLDEWAEQMASLHLPWALAPTDAESFEASVRYRALTSMSVAEFTGGGFSGSRADSPGRASDVIGVTFNVDGIVRCRMPGAEFDVGPGRLWVWTAEAAQGFSAGNHREITILTSEHTAPRRLLEIADRTGEVAFAGPGAGLMAIAGRQIASVVEEIDFLGDSEIATACLSALDLVVAAARPITDAHTSHRDELLARVEHYLRDNIGDPALTPSAIANAHAISVRTLHQLFANTGVSVSEAIRDRRLRAAYRELANAGEDTRVTDVAFSWGFNDGAHFSRLFKKKFGISPSTLLGRGPHR